MPPYPPQHRGAFLDALDTATADVLDRVGDLPAGSPEQAAAAALAMQLNSYRWWIRSGWVDPFAVTGVLIAGRVPGMTVPGEQGFPFAPGGGRR
jgi:hypothetical protein